MSRSLTARSGVSGDRSLSMTARSRATGDSTGDSMEDSAEDLAEDARDHTTRRGRRRPFLGCTSRAAAIAVLVASALDFQTVFRAPSQARTVSTYGFLVYLQLPCALLSSFPSWVKSPSICCKGAPCFSFTIPTSSLPRPPSSRLGRERFSNISGRSENETIASSVGSRRSLGGRQPSGYKPTPLARSVRVKSTLVLMATAALRFKCRVGSRLTVFVGHRSRLLQPRVWSVA